MSELIRYTNKEAQSELLFTHEFHQLKRKHPGILNEIRRIEATIDPEELREGTVYEGKGFTLEVLSTKDFYHPKLWVIFKLVINDEEDAFVIKITPALKEAEQGGVEEIKAVSTIERIIKEKHLDKVKVVPYLLGYRDQRKAYYVSKWLPYPTLGSYMRTLHQGGDEWYKLHKRVSEITKELKNQFTDLNPENMLYDASSDIIYIFDTHPVRHT